MNFYIKNCRFDCKINRPDTAPRRTDEEIAEMLEAMILVHEAVALLPGLGEGVAKKIAIQERKLDGEHVVKAFVGYFIAVQKSALVFKAGAVYKMTYKNRVISSGHNVEELVGGIGVNCFDGDSPDLKFVSHRHGKMGVPKDDVMEIRRLFRARFPVSYKRISLAAWESCPNYPGCTRPASSYH